MRPARAPWIPRLLAGASRGRLLCAALVATAAWSFAPAASAYCRSTTCTGDCARDADGCKIDGAPLYWASACVGFSLQKDSSEYIPYATFREVAIKSFLAWTDIQCDGGAATMAFQELGPVACHEAEYNPDAGNANVILFQDYKWTYTGVDNTLAKTTVTYDLETGEIFDADIELNHAFNELTTGDDHVVYDLQSILTHEIGHMIGLDHTPDYDATMNAAYESGTTELRTLEADDMAAVCAAYPPDRAAVCNTTPHGGLASLCGALQEAEDGGGCAVAAPQRGGGSGLAVLGAGVLGVGALAVRARRRRRR